MLGYCWSFPAMLTRRF